VTTLTPAQIAAVAKGAGFRDGAGYQGRGLTWAVAIAIAESGGVVEETTTNTDKWRSVDRGLWQINNHWHAEVTDAAALNAASCAAAAFTISRGGLDWHEWSTFKNGLAGAQLARAAAAAASPAAPPASSATATEAGSFWDGVKGAAGTGTGGLIPGLPAGTVPGVPNPLNIAGDLIHAFAAIPAAIIATAKWISNPHNWVRVMWVIGGGVGIIVGFKMLADSDAGVLSSVGRAGVTAAHKVNSGVKTAALAVPGIGEGVGVAKGAKAATAAAGARVAAKGAGRVAAGAARVSGGSAS
jgi:hypothetical protein